jgi:thiamine biosynthesis lipoprotein
VSRLALLVLALLPAGDVAASEPQTVSRGRPAMGTVLEITAQGPETARLERAVESALAVVARLESLLSRYEPQSDVSRINRGAGGPSVVVAADVVDLLAASIEAARTTHGAFDVTVGPLIELWTRAAERDALPSDAELAEATARVGVEGIRLEPPMRVLLAAGRSIDLGGIAKGFALDRALPRMQRMGVETALLSFGQSSTLALGAPAGAAGWRLLVRSPDEGFAGVVTLRDQALSVSGSLGQWSRIAGRSFGHVVDPRSGWPLTARRQAIVVAPDATRAEALSTALLVLGETEGIALLESLAGCEGLLLDARGGRFATSGFVRETRFEPLVSAPPI